MCKEICRECGGKGCNYIGRSDIIIAGTNVANIPDGYTVKYCFYINDPDFWVIEINPQPQPAVDKKE